MRSSDFAIESLAGSVFQVVMPVLPAPVTELTDSDNDVTEVTVGAAKAKARSKGKAEGKAKAKGLVPTSKSKLLKRPAASCEESTVAPSTADEKAKDPAPKAKTKADSWCSLFNKFDIEVLLRF